MKTLFVSILLVFALIITVPAAAQDEPTCTPEQWADIATAFSTLADNLAASETPFDDLLAIQTQLGTARAICSGGVFTKADYPDGIIGPINFGGTLYKATLESVGSVATLERVEISGDCAFFVSIITPFSGGSESDLWEFEECQALFEINATAARDWTLTIERLK